MVKYPCKNQHGGTMQIPVEIERKYVILMPDAAVIEAQEAYTVSDIEQTYLESAPTVTHRVRARRRGDVVTYTETKKARIDKMSVFEDEREIAEDEYRELLGTKKMGTTTVRKTRRTFEYQGHTFEIDTYPEWEKTAILETELASRDEKVEFPSFITVVTEVTGDKKYSNASMSHEFPKELI